MLRALAPEIMFSRKDPADPRLGDLSKSLALNEFLESSFNWGLIGYPDDEGIRLNGGRPGAALAPDLIRQFFYKMTPSLFSQAMEGVADLGNLNAESLAERHQEAKSVSSRGHSSGKRMLSLGGGHDYGYSDCAGFLEVYGEQNPLVINIDAHLDVRPLDRGLTSGTPFFRLLSEFKGKFDFVELGIQAHCNSQNHLKWAQDHGAHIIFLEEIQQKGLVGSLDPFLKSKRPTFLSLDIDGIVNADAPGCSQGWATGIEAKELFKLLPLLYNQMDLRGIGIYEVSPPLDQDNRTSKLAALILHHLISM